MRLLNGEKDGLYQNVDKITEAHLYDGSNEDGGNIQQDKDDNADQQTERVRNGLFRRYHVYMIAPIDYDKKKWDTSVVQQITESVFVGKLSDSKTSGEKKTNNDASVCLMLRELPYHHKRYPSQAYPLPA